jgi:solute carrier family 35 (UDP-sugar transporter), member A1/2/3
MATMLKKRLNSNQIISLVMLFVGVSIIQLQNINYFKASNDDEKNALLGLVCVLIASFSSGFAGVYFEKILRNSNISLWVRNLQLSFLGAIFSIFTVYTYDGKNVNEFGFFYGYNYGVWITISVQSFGGLLVAVVMKYADNILKGFATSIAIILSCSFSFYFFDTHISPMFLFGTLVVILSVLFYSYIPYKAQIVVTIIPTSVSEKIGVKTEEA